MASPREGVLPEISTWQERLVGSGDPNLEVVAGTLDELKTQLDAPGLDPVSVGALFMSPGDQVRQVAGAEIGAGAGNPCPHRRRLEALGFRFSGRGCWVFAMPLRRSAGVWLV